MAFKRQNKPRSAKWITLLNHKGGVGKTTLSLHLAAILSEKGAKVLLVDADPQCNLSTYLVEPEYLDSLLDKSDSEQGRTLWTAVAPVAEGTGPVRLVSPFETAIQSVSLFVGDIRLSEFESHLGSFWLEALALKSRGYNGVAALARAVRRAATSVQCDYIICDTAPSVGDLNRCLVLSSDYFLIPAYLDLFSVRALKTLGVALRQWINEWRRIEEMAPADADLQMNGTPRFLGYVLQRVNSSADDRQGSTLESQFQRHLFEDVVNLLGNGLNAAPRGYRLGTVPELDRFIVQSQLKGDPVWDIALDKGDPKLAEEAKSAFSEIADRIAELTKGR